MTARERFLKVLNFEKPDGRLPMVEWAPWWDKTILRWEGEGLSKELPFEDTFSFFGLDKMICLSGAAISKDCPKPAEHGAAIISDEASYEAIMPFLFTDAILESLAVKARALKEKHERGEVIIRLWLDGFFWFPRKLFGIEGHLYAFYDHPELMHRMNQDLAAFNIRVLDTLLTILKPDMVGFAEDMSYNLGPMLSYEMFREFLLPYYQLVVPAVKAHGIKVFIDSDGDVTTMIPWFEEAGIEGVYPLERQAGVDVAKIRREHPQFLLLGGYDKMVMSKGEDAMRAEFERLLPVMKSGGFVPSVDHQTPPGVSLANYNIYVRLFEEYCSKAAMNFI